MIIAPTLPPYPPSLPDPKPITPSSMSLQSHIQIHLQTYTIVAPASDNLCANYDLYRSSRSFTMSLFVLHCTPYMYTFHMFNGVFLIKKKNNDHCLDNHRCKCNHKHIQFIALPMTTSMPTMSCIGVLVRSQSYFSFYTVRFYSRQRFLNFLYFL